jgi:hypothetical protein
MGTLAPYVGDSCHEVRRKLSLDIEVPLLNVRPLGYGLDVCRRFIVDCEREEDAAVAADAFIPGVG